MVQLPAVNTPQFDWARSHMPRRAQPVPPIYQPEVVARHIVQAALHAPRELWVGTPSVKAILGTMLAPGLLDRLLARRGYGGQMTDEPEPPDRPDNLVAAVPGDPGMHGRFDDRARDHVPALNPAWPRGTAALALAALLPLAWRGIGAPDRYRRLPRR